MDEGIIFVLCDELPTYYDAAIAIFSVCKSPKTKKMADTINAYSSALIDIWQQCFDREHVISRSNVLFQN